MEKEIEPSDELYRMVKITEKKIRPNQEETELVNLGIQQNVKEVKIGVKLAINENERMTELLKEFMDAFTWSSQDMPGLDTDIVVHKLLLKKGFEPINQKLKLMHPKIYLKIKEEIRK